MPRLRGYLVSSCGYTVDDNIMGELPVEVSWLTAIAVERLASYFADGQIHGMGNWTEELSKLTTRTELEEVQGAVFS